MSKSKHSGSPLYMTTRELADLIIQALDEQNYFKTDEVAHPHDIAIAFSTVAETIGTTMSWAISQEHKSKKNAVMQTGDLRKDVLSVDDFDYSETKYRNVMIK